MLLIYPPTFKTEAVLDSLFSCLPPSPPLRSIPAAEKWGEERRWNGVDWSASPSLTCPSPNKHRAGHGRGGPLLSPGFLCAPNPSPGATSPSIPPHSLAPGLGPAELGSWPRATNL